MEKMDLEKLYSPSMWNKRCAPTDVTTNFVKLGQDATLRARKNTRCEIDVPYGPSERTKYDIYGIDLPDESPIFVLIHGGYWQKMSKDEYAFPAETFVSQGIKFICVGYDLCPNVRLREIVSQIKTAMRKILQYASKSGSRGVWVGGHSAGAHLAASLLDSEWLQQQNSTLLKSLVLLSGIYFLEPLISTSYNEALKLESTEAELMSTLSIKLPAPVQNLKVMVVIGDCDSPAFIEQARELTKLLCSSVDDVEYKFLRSGIDHFSIIENLAHHDFPLTQKIIESINNSTV
ncbi:kynurenine formamidase [Athalia rosae]|uniref:kynurenine formamidase n=1 Tax=Athalia rosae TaxID=37344 RepID=UPI00203383A7|nr:kynurenine formamidase [Athalia rosae]XP_020707004.2 kynurenine formamidase [Athalia rosae]XP_048505191.1 kynurenine formamidase [Athalia rosae]